MITGVTRDAAMSSEETFGPVAGIARFATEEEAIAHANDTPYGLAAYFYSRDLGRIWRVSEALEYGIVGINTGFISTEVAPFGGDQGVGHRPRGLEVRDRRVARDQVPRDGRWSTVIVEQRDYHVFTGKLPEVVRMYEEEGIALQQEHLGNFLAAFTTDVGALSTYTAHVGLRELRRPRAAACASFRPTHAGRTSCPGSSPSCTRSRTAMLVPTAFSPIR